MKFSATLVSIALFLAGSVEAHAHIGNHHRRTGPSATPSSAPASTPTPAPPTTVSTTKRGVSFNDPKAVQHFGDKISWAYNWSPAAGGDLPSYIKFYPQLWSDSPDKTKSWHDDATAAIAAGANYLLGFNEPDLSAQANMSPQAAAAAWRQFMEPFAGKAKLCSPAITNGGAPMGTAWLESFLSECNDCTIDCIAFHIYDSATNVQYFKNYITDMGKYGKPTLMTEFGASGSVQDQQNFLNQMIPFLEGLETLEGYAYFMAGQNILVDGSDALTALGQTYNSA